MTPGPRVRKTDLDRSATTLLEFLERNRRTGGFDFPFSSSFPRNSCESVSLILKDLFEEKYGLEDVLIIRGSKPCGDEHHFWVVANGVTYDLTAHQFDGQKPIVGVLAHPLHLDEFPDWSTEVDRTFVERDDVVSRFRAGTIPF